MRVEQSNSLRSTLITLSGAVSSASEQVGLLHLKCCETDRTASINLYNSREPEQSYLFLLSQVKHCNEVLFVPEHSDQSSYLELLSVSFLHINGP